MKIALIAINAKYIHSSLALRYLKNACKGADAELYEFTINDRVANVVARLFETGCDLFAFSCYIWNREFVLRVCGLLKEVTDCRILLGGPEVSYDPQELMEQFPFVDYIIAGEGECAFADFSEGMELDQIGGLCWRKDSEVVCNPQHPPISNLDLLSLAYDRQELEGLRGKIIYYETSRGCPYGCSYCLSSTVSGVRNFSLERIKQDLLLFMECKVPLIKLVDRTFNTDSKRCAEILRFILAHNQESCFHFEIAADILSDKVMELLESAPAGTFQIEAGVQSVNLQTLEAVNRPMDLKRLAKNVIRLRQNAKVHIHLDLIAGLPHEDFASFRESFTQVFKLSPHALQLGFLKLLKGAPIRSQAADHKYQYDPLPPYEVLANRYMSYGELLVLKEIEDVVEKYHNSGVFEKSCAYAASRFGSPFDFFARFAAYLKNTNPEGRVRGRKELYQLFCEFYTENQGNDPIFLELLKYDFILHNQGVAMPSWVLCRGDKTFYQAWNERVKDTQNMEAWSIKKDIRAQDFAKFYRFERFCYDVTGDLSAGEFVLLFDYLQKCTKKVLGKA